MANWVLEDVMPKPTETKILEMKKHRPLLLIEGVTVNQNNVPVEYVRGLYRNDKYKFSIEMTR